MNGPNEPVDLPTDNELMLRVRDGEADPLGQLFERHHRMLFNFFVQLTGNREVSEDLVQDVFFRILKYRQSFRPDSRFISWMYQIARHAQADAWRKRRHEVALDGETDDRVCPAPAPDERLRRQQEFTQLQRALARLPKEKREVLILSRIQGLKHEEIAAILDCEVGAVKVRVHRALKELRDIFCEQENTL